MYIPTHNRFDNRAAQLDLIDAHSLGRWIDPDDAEARPDREGTVVGLQASGSEAARTMAALVQHALNTSPR